MKETVTVYRFLDVFKGSNTYQNNFSHDGLIALFEYIEELEDDIGEEIEFDMVGPAGFQVEFFDCQLIQQVVL